MVLILKLMRIKSGLLETERPNLDKKLREITDIDSDKFDPFAAIVTDKKSTTRPDDCVAKLEFYIFSKNFFLFF